jgi:hypothetical protein
MREFFLLFNTPNRVYITILTFFLLSLSPHCEFLGTGSGIQLPFPNVAAPLNDEVSSAAADLQQLSLGKEEPAVSPSEVDHAVLFPEYALSR